MSEPPRILVFGEGISLAHVSRAFLVARELKRRGSAVRFLTAERYQSWARQRGLAAQAIYTPDAQSVYTRLRALEPMYTADEVVRSVQADLAQIEAFQPDVLVGDCRNSLRISSELTGVPYVAISNANCTPWFAGVLNAPAALPINRVLGKQRVDRFIMPWLGKPIRKLACRSLNKPFAEAQKLMGASRACSDFREMFTSDDLHLLADLPPFQPAQSLPDHVRYIGPLFWASDSEHQAATRDALDRIDDSRPLVYLSMGSSGLDKLLDELAPVLNSLPYEFLVTVGEQVRQEGWGANLHTVPFASAPLVLARAAAVVCHGGNGTVYQALAHGVPVIAIPSFFDQEIQADQLVHHGLGVRLEPGEAAGRIAEALERVVDQPIALRRLKRWQAQMRQWEAADAAAEAIDQFVAERRREEAPCVQSDPFQPSAAVAV